MLDERKEGDPLQGARVMLMGRAEQTDDAHIRRRYLARQPEAAMFVDFPDFAFYRVVVTGAHLVAGFGRIVDLKPQGYSCRSLRRGRIARGGGRRGRSYE